jgi:hypothetical protein
MGTMTVSFFTGGCSFDSTARTTHPTPMTHMPMVTTVRHHFALRITVTPSQMFEITLRRPCTGFLYVAGDGR